MKKEQKERLKELANTFFAVVCFVFTVPLLAITLIPALVLSFTYSPYYYVRFGDPHGNKKFLNLPLTVAFPLIFLHIHLEEKGYL